MRRTLPVQLDRRLCALVNPVDETELAALLAGAGLLQGELAPRLRDAVRVWCAPLARGYLAKIMKATSATARNNWHSHRIKIGTAAAIASGDAALVDQAREEFALQVLRNIEPGGLTFDFQQRDALHYVVFTLEPLLAAATMAAAHGQDWYGAAAAGGRLRQALEWLLPYAKGERRHEEFVNSRVGFDRLRAQAGVKEFSGPWQRERAATAYWLAARLDPRFRTISAELAPPPWVQALHTQQFY